jgi:hypothetical protein
MCTSDNSVEHFANTSDIALVDVPMDRQRDESVRKSGSARILLSLKPRLQLRNFRDRRRI